MLGAYKREQQIMPIGYRSELKGIRVDIDKLDNDLIGYESTLLKVKNDIRKAVKNQNLDIGCNDDLADALENAGMVKGWILTPTGKRSTSKTNLEAVVTHAPTLALLK